MSVDVALYTFTQAVDSTEWSCTADSSTLQNRTNVGCIQQVLDLSDMVAGDELLITLYEKVISGGTRRVLEQWSLAGAQAKPHWSSPGFFLGVGWDFSVKAIAGTITIDGSTRIAS